MFRILTAEQLLHQIRRYPIFVVFNDDRPGSRIHAVIFYSREGAAVEKLPGPGMIGQGDIKLDANPAWYVMNHLQVLLQLQ